MKSVFIGQGKLADKGVYAARDFAKGELVVPYKLKELSQKEFDDLPEGESEWTRSFHGKIFLFPEPERYVNHDENPSTHPDHKQGGDVALRDIKKGEAITINDRVELQYELETFLKTYETASNSCNFDRVAPLVADDATYWFTNGTFKGQAAIRKAFEDTWARIKKEKYTITDIRWVAMSYWVSACTYSFVSDGIVSGERRVFNGCGTSVLKRIRGNWRVVHEHLSKALE